MRRFHDHDTTDEREMHAVGHSSEGHDLSPIITRPNAKAAAEPAVEKEEEFTPEFLSCCRSLAPIISSIAGLIMIVWLVITSGTYSGSATPKVAVIVFEGLRGDIFQSAVIDGNKAPFIKALLGKDVSSYATCYGVDDAMCARSQSGPALGPIYTFGAAPGIASILTGVNAQRHMVTNDTTAALTNFATTSAKYPSLPKYLKSKGYTTAAVGTSKLLTTLSPEGTCTSFGVLDYECGVDIVQRCFRSNACNLDARVLTPTSKVLGEEEVNMVDGINSALQENPDLLIFHTSKLARGAADATRPAFTYDATSAEYLAELYQLDAVIGQMVAELRVRAQMYRENWLLIGTSAHGGSGKSTNYVTANDEIVPFFVAPLTAATITLNALTAPASQMDVYPTVLQWLGVERPANVTFDGQTQGICTTGLQLRNCTN